MLGQRVRYRRLSTDAVYDVVAVDGHHVSVVVVSAPLLAPGTEVRMTREAVLGMDLLSASASLAPEGRPPAPGGPSPLHRLNLHTDDAG
jgi:hypothetical protein